ncbi:hypothetical protein KY290_031112 [Solanum tuberosum]|uniref:Uncharacterized protein n=1 Tax=Solanum tuberosum TaxID=4113 RepID=A0ABQ7UA39_SOLTU|nr:hypothetical protein KY290_031112 [Solanum tuberosum]
MVRAGQPSIETEAGFLGHQSMDTNYGPGEPRTTSTGRGLTYDPWMVTVYLLQGKKSKRLKQSEKNESINNTKEKGFESNKPQSPLKNLDTDMQYRSSAELVNTFKIKKEHISNECNNKAKKEHAPIAHKRKNYEDFIQPQGKSNLFGHKSNKPRLFQSGESIQEKGIKLTMHNFSFQTSSKEGVTASVHVTGTTLGNEEEQHDIQDLLSFKQVKRKLVLPATSVDKFLKKQYKEHDIDHDLPNIKHVKKKSVIPATSLDQFQKQQGIVIGDERKHVNHTVADVEYMPAPFIHEHTKGLDDLEDQEEIGEDDCAIDEEVDIDCSTKGISKQEKVRGQTTCMNIHARNLEEREK